MEIKQATSKKQFQCEAKEYVINMTNNAKRLHKKNGCYYSKILYNYYDFATEEEANKSGITYNKCKNCFK